MYQNIDWDNNTGTEWWTVGVRPMYKWTPIAKLPCWKSALRQREISADRHDRNNQYKITYGATVARRATASEGRVRRYPYFSPPTRKWDERNGAISKKTAIATFPVMPQRLTPAFSTNSRGDSDEWTFGAQMEAGGNTMVI